MRWLFLQSWNGQDKLWKVVWIYGVFLIFLGQVAIPVLRLTKNIDLDHPTGTQVCFLGWLEGLYCIWMLVALWRCAFNADSRIWGYFVRPLVILYMVLFLMFSTDNDDGKVIEPKEVFTRSATILKTQALHLFKRKHDQAPPDGASATPGSPQ